MINDDLYDGILDRDEWWIIVDKGCAMIIYDASLMDC
jgi:hypothetical protein